MPAVSDCVRQYWLIQSRRVLSVPVTTAAPKAGKAVVITINHHQRNNLQIKKVSARYSLVPFGE